MLELIREISGDVKGNSTAIKTIDGRLRKLEDRSLAFTSRWEFLTAVLGGGYVVFDVVHKVLEYLR
ncbi:MAG: hypothetical protein AAGG51_22985 [Cyanobacteria bacterium P01_G01_bin.54]